MEPLRAPNIPFPTRHAPGRYRHERRGLSLAAQGGIQKPSQKDIM